MSQERLEALERMLLEVDALTAIFCADVGNVLHCSTESVVTAHEDFFVTSVDAIKKARSFVEDSRGVPSEIPRIEIEAFVRSSCAHPKNKIATVHLRIGLPSGYPLFAGAEVTVLAMPNNYHRSYRDRLSMRLKTKTEELIGAESMMEIINECQDALAEWESEEENCKIDDEVGSNEEQDEDGNKQQNTAIARRWIWVHHITNTSRLKQIVSEAQDLKLGGYVKGGFPGVVVVEGPAQACEEFVAWIKGSKSQMNGFGRNWGHHVRGEAADENRRFTEAFIALEDDMGKLGAICSDAGLEDEFREFVLQHK